MLIVQKFGGTSVGDIERIHRVARRVIETQRQGHRVVAVVSAMAGQTNHLCELANAVGGTYDRREMDVLLASGEQIAIALLAMAINQQCGQLGHATSLLGYQTKIVTNSLFTRARIQQINTSPLLEILNAGRIPVVAGFQGIDEQGNITTLGRGGSDTTAVAIAASLAANLCEIYTDVEGVYTTDPRICPKAKLIPRITFQEMLEMASLGAKVLEIRSVELASKFNVPLRVRSSFSEKEGTMVIREEDALEKVPVTGVSLDKNQARVTVRGLPCVPGMQSQLFRPLAERGYVVDIIVQNPPLDGKTNLSFTVPLNDLTPAMEAIRPVVEYFHADSIMSDDQVAKISIVGVGMRNQPGIAQKMFDLLSQQAIEIFMISTSEIKVSCVIARTRGEEAVRALHEGFGLE